MEAGRATGKALGNPREKALANSINGRAAYNETDREASEARMAMARMAMAMMAIQMQVPHRSREGTASWMQAMTLDRG